MIGRQVILPNCSFTLKELEMFMGEKWDKETYNAFVVGHPTPASIEEYIMLPATQRFMVIVYPRSAGSLFSRKNKIILSVCQTPDGAKEWFTTSIPSHSIFFGAWKISTTMSIEKERKGPAEKALQKYAIYFRELLKQEDYL
ncbi:MAG: hypothetical protein SOR61_05075 [Evtepia sp.]|uniref:hypothetical protein n=1 Tax=Evtepia sp. TaxID=2773933 RepID=UPI002A74EF55|nr:hypothetical protein [Evtepia sp.]MDY3014551.1 hypothetical protein [Evtepia sp.]